MKNVVKIFLLGIILFSFDNKLFSQNNLNVRRSNEPIRQDPGVNVAPVRQVASQEEQSKPLPKDIKLERIDFSKASGFNPRYVKNLQIVFIKGLAASGPEYICLSEAMKKGLVKVEETGNVQKLTIENTSPSAKVFVQAGDIVKGGRQDRTLQTDMILSPKSGKIPLPSFCVEQSRWSKRGEESESSFGDSDSSLSSRSLKGAACLNKNQGIVWDSIAAQQEKLNTNVSRMTGKNVNVRSSKSATSLELTMDNPDLKKIIAEYQKGIGGLPEDSVGYLYAVNGEFCGGDIYSGNKLFAALWPKVSKSIIVEAISENGSYEKGMTLLPEGAAKILSQFKDQEPQNSFVQPITAVSKYWKGSVFRMDSYDASDKEHASWVHTSILNASQSQARTSDGYDDSGEYFGSYSDEFEIVNGNLDPSWNVILEHLEYEDKNVKDILVDIKKKLKGKIANGKNLEFKYVEKKQAANEKRENVTVTMIVDDIPLLEALYYICRAGNLRCKIDGTTAVLSQER